MKRSPISGFRVCVFVPVVMGALCNCSTTPAAKEARFLARGQALMQARDYPRAALEFRSAITVMPSDAEPYFQLAKLSLLRAETQGAITLLNKALQLNPKHTGAQLQLAALMAASSDQPTVMEAQRRVQGVLDASPNNADALDLLANVESHLGKVDDALKHLELANEKAPKNIKAAIDLAHTQLYKGNVAGTEATLNKLVQSDPKSVPAALAVAGFFLRMGKSAQAEQQVRRALQLDPKNTDGWLLLASLQTAAKRKDLAEQSYQQLSNLSDRRLRMAYARFLLDEGKRDQAEAELKRLVKQFGDDRDYRSALVEYYVEQQRYAEADSLLAAAIKTNPKDTDALQQRAELLARVGRYKDAIENLQAVLHFKRDSDLAHYALARVYGLSGSRLLQRQELAEAIRINPRLTAARSDLTFVLLRNKELQPALAVIDQTPASQKMDTRYLVTRNWVLLALGNLAEVRSTLDGALKASRPPELVYQDAVLKVGQKDYAAGRKSLEEVLKAFPNSLGVLELMATSYSAQGNLPKALDFLREYSAQHPKSAPIQYLTGTWLERAGKHSEAYVAFKAAQAADPNFVPALLVLAEADIKRGDLEGAQRLLTSVVSQYPDNISAHMLLAVKEQAAGNRPAEIEQYRAIIALDSKNVVALNNLASELTNQSPDEALKYAESAVEADPGNAGAQDTLGWAYYRHGLYGNAVTHLKQAVAKEANPTRKYHLGLAYAKVGEVALARQNVDAALKQDPKLALTEQSTFK